MRKFKYFVFCLVVIVCLIILSACSLPGATSPTSPAASETSSRAPITTSTSPQTTPVSAQSTSAPAQNTQPVAAVPLPSFADLLAATEGAVVKIDTTGTAVSLFGRTVQQQGAGSGWIIDSNGSIVTNNHVIDGATSISVTTLDGKQYPAQVANADSVNDLAVLKITASQLPTLKVGDASKIRVGDWVLAIGNPLGEGIIATQGIVSRLKVDLQISATESYSDLIETSAAINPGNSGGPLINLSGEVIGITSAKVSASGIEGMGYAINMADAYPIIQKLSAK